jgi:hypothetical protein
MISRLRFDDVYVDNSRKNIIIQACIFGIPGIEIHIGDSIVNLNVEQSKQLSDLLQCQYGGVSEVFTFYDDESTKKKLQVMDSWDVIMDDSRNSNDFGVNVNNYLVPGKKYRITITELPEIVK